MATAVDGRCISTTSASSPISVAGTGDDIVIAACILAGHADRAGLDHEARIRRIARVEQRLITTHAPGFRTDRQHPQNFDAQQF